MTVIATVNATLNGQGGSLTVFEDSSGDGTADNSETLSLIDGVADYQFETLSGDTSYDYWVTTELTTSDSSTTPEIDSVTVDPNPQTTNVSLSTNATLNAETIEATLFEDTDGDGTYNNRLRIAIPDGTATIGVYQLDGSSTNTFWIQVDLETADTSTTPQVDSLTVSAGIENTDTGSITTATGSLFQPSETASLSVSPSVVQGSAITLTPGETATLQTAPGVVTASATVISAGDVARDTIAGTVTLDGSGVDNARIYIINTDTDTIEATTTTDANGDYSVTVPGEPTYHVTVQYDDGSQKYNALSKPYIE